MIVRMLNILLLALTLAYLAHSTEPQLIFLQQLHRHGDRYPIFPNHVDGSDYYLAHHQKGVLTAPGKNRLYQLGKSFFKDYWHRLFGDDLNFHPSKFYFRSTNKHRTIQSLQNSLRGLLEEVTSDAPDWDIPFSGPTPTSQPDAFGDFVIRSNSALKMHVKQSDMSPQTGGDYLRTYSLKYCINQNKWAAANRQDHYIKQVITKNPNFTHAVAQLSKAIGKQLTFFDVYIYYDNALSLMDLHKQPLPIFKHKNNITEAFRVIYSLDEYISLFYTENQMRTTTTGFFQATINDFKRVIDDQSGVQWIVYSAHDSTLMSILARMGMTSAKCIYEHYLNGTLSSQNEYCIVDRPPFGTPLIFELYQHPDESNTFKVRYNGHHRRIPFCHWQFQCDVEVLYRWFQTWKLEDYVRNCLETKRLRHAFPQ